MSRHGNLVVEIIKMAKTCFRLVQIDSYLDTSWILVKQTFIVIMVKIQPGDVIF